MDRTKDLVAHFVIRGEPVASAHKNRIGRGAGGRAMLFPTDEWKTWFASAISQVEKTLRRGGYEVQREPCLVKRGPNKGQPTVNEHGQPTNVVNPLFTGGGYRIVIHYHYPLEAYRLDPVGAVLLSKPKKGEEPRPIVEPYQFLDTDNVVKGTIDALQEGGAIEKDRTTVPIAVPVPDLALGDEPYLVVEVKYFDSTNPDDWIIPRPGFVPLVDPRLFMPRVFDGGHDWHVLRKMERAYIEQQRRKGIEVVQAPVTKARCRRCTALIGEGWPSTEIWWDVEESRWGKEVVLICASCGRDAALRKPKFVEALDRNTLAMCAANGTPLTEIPSPQSNDRPFYDMVRERVREVLLGQYREKYCLVSSDEIATVDWITIAERQRSRQRETFPSEKNSDSNRPQHRPSVVHRPRLQDRRDLPHDDGEVQEPGGDSGVLHARPDADQGRGLRGRDALIAARLTRHYHAARHLRPTDPAEPA